MNRTTLFHGISGVVLALAAFSTQQAAADYYSEVGADNPVVWYKFNETAGAGVAANSGSAGASYDTNAINSPTFGVASGVAGGGTAVDLGTVASDARHFRITNPATGSSTFHYTNWLNGNNATLEFWINTTQTTGGGDGWNQPTLMGDDNGGDCCGGGGTDSWWGVLATNANNGQTLGSVGYNTANNPITAASSSAVNDGSWHHVAIVRDNSAMIQVYVDGLADGSPAAAGTPDNLWDTIGRDDADDNSQLLAKIDEVAIYDTALSPARISAHYNAAAIPEPSTMVLAALGLLGLAGFAFRKRRRG